MALMTWKQRRADCRLTVLYKPFHIEDLTSAVREALLDGAASAPGLLVLSDQRLERLTHRLTDLRYEVNAQCILLADITGQLMAEVGVTEGISPSMLTC